MRSLKFSHTLILAILTASITVGNKANFKKKAITLCFTQIEVQDVPGISVVLNASPIRSCIAAKSEVIYKPIVKIAIVATAIPSGTIPCPSTRYFCCAKVTEINPSVEPALWAAAPAIDLGEGAKKYKIASSIDVYCKFLP